MIKKSKFVKKNAYDDVSFHFFFQNYRTIFVSGSVSVYPNPCSNTDPDPAMNLGKKPRYILYFFCRSKAAEKEALRKLSIIQEAYQV